MIVDQTNTEETTDVYTSSSQTPAPAESGRNQKSIQVKMGVTQAAIEKMQAHAQTLTIAGNDDKTGFNSVYAFRQSVKDQRIAVEKVGKALKDPHTAYNRQVDQIMKNLTEPMKTIENDLSAMEKGFNEARDKAKKEKELAQFRRVSSRAKTMRGFGFEHDEVRDTYLFVNQRTGEEVSIPFEDIRDLSDEDFRASFDLAKKTYDDDQAELAQIKRDQEAEAQRIRDEQTAAQKVIDDQRRELKEKQDAFDQQQAEFAEQKRQLKELQDKTLLDQRVPELLHAGFTWNGKSYWNGSVLIKPEMLVVLTDDVFTGILIDAKTYADEQEQARIDQENADQQAEIDKHNADQERQARLAPEKGRFLAYLEKLWGMPIPTMTEPEMEGLAESFGSELEKLITHYQNQIEQL